MVDLIHKFIFYINNNDIFLQKYQEKSYGKFFTLSNKTHVISRFVKNFFFKYGNWIDLKKKSTIMLKSCFFWKMLPFLIQCGFGRGKQPAICGKSSSKYLHDFILRILIYTESIKTSSRKRQVIHWFQRIFLRFSLY